jgi:hypothetical protein
MSAVAAQPPPSPVPETLWQHVLHWIGEHASSFHPFDEWRLFGQLQQMHAVGERPTVAEMRAYSERLWPLSPALRRGVCDAWRTILRHPHRRFRVVEARGGWGLLSLDRLTTEHGLRRLDERLHDVAQEALERFQTVALEDADLETWLSARRDVDRALDAIDRLRGARLGRRAVGEYYAGESSIEELYEWRKLKRRYGRA